MLSSVFLSSNDPATLTFDVEALAGDFIQLTLLPGGEDNAPLAFDYAVTLLGAAGEIFPGKCMFAATFDDDAPFEDRCGGANMENLNDEIGPPGTTVEGESVNEQHGLARVFGEGQYIRSVGAPMDYRGDFTVQYWSRPDDPQPNFGTVPFADRHGLAQAAASSSRSTRPRPFMEACYIWDDGTTPPEPLCACIVGMQPRDGNWHFTRLSRDAAAGTISLCVDGASRTPTPRPGAFDMSTDQAPHLGRNVNFSPAYYGGGLDDVRVFKRALPCSAAP